MLPIGRRKGAPNLNCLFDAGHLMLSIFWWLKSHLIKVQILKRAWANSTVHRLRKAVSEGELLQRRRPSNPGYRLVELHPKTKPLQRRRPGHLVDRVVEVPHETKFFQGCRQTSGGNGLVEQDPEGKTFHRSWPADAGDGLVKLLVKPDLSCSDAGHTTASIGWLNAAAKERCSSDAGNELPWIAWSKNSSHLSPRTSCCKRAGQLNCFPKTRVINDGGQETPAIAWLNFSPKVCFSIRVGHVTSWMGLLKQTPKVTHSTDVGHIRRPSGCTACQTSGSAATLARRRRPPCP